VWPLSIQCTSAESSTSLLRIKNDTESLDTCVQSSEQRQSLGDQAEWQRAARRQARAADQAPTASHAARPSTTRHPSRVVDVNSKMRNTRTSSSMVSNASALFAPSVATTPPRVHTTDSKSTTNDNITGVAEHEEASERAAIHRHRHRLAAARTLSHSSST
jgi:hypothetical protein